MLQRAVDLDPHSKMAQKNLGDALARKQIDLDRAKVPAAAERNLKGVEVFYRNSRIKSRP